MLGKKGEWKNVNEELPPEDGDYEITNFPHYEDDWCRRQFTAMAYYDGYGFKYLGVYRTPEFWRKYDYEAVGKRYGKIFEKGAGV